MSAGTEAVESLRWVVCEYPERAIDSNAQWHIFGRCHGCMVAMGARLARGEERRPVMASLVMEPTPPPDA